MKNILKKKNILLVTFFAVLIILVGYGVKNDQDTFVKEVLAQAEEGKCTEICDECKTCKKGGGTEEDKCTEICDECKTCEEGGSGECNGSFGNLYGYIDTENLGPVYLSTESWNDLSGEVETSINFYVNYDRQDGIWSGRGWNRQVGWVDFSYDQINDFVIFQGPGENPSAWGGWDGEVDLSEIVYSAQNGSFRGDGYGAHNDTGGEPSELEDDYIGSGEWTFEGVQFQDPLCPQIVDLFLDGTSYLYREDCGDVGTSTIIQWLSEGVHSCESVEGFWTNKSRPVKNIGTEVKANADITEDNAPVLFKLRCIGEYSESPVEGVAMVSCGDVLPPCENPPCGSGHGGEGGMISPNIIEA